MTASDRSNGNGNKSKEGPAEWNSLMPGVSCLEDAINILGPVELQGRYGNADWYEFADRTVQIVILDGQTTILKIRVLSNFPEVLVPKDLNKVESTFGKVEQVEVERSGTVIFERAGLRVACGLLGNPKPVQWIEFIAH